MNQVILNNLHPSTIEKLQILAQIHNHSLEEEIKEIVSQFLKNEAIEKQLKFEQSWARIDAARQQHEDKLINNNVNENTRTVFREKLNQARLQHGNKLFSDSTELLREDRQR